MKKAVLPFLLVLASCSQNQPPNLQPALDSINAESGTTLVQLQVDNPGHLLLPGGFVNLHFALPSRAVGVWPTCA